MTNSVRLPAWLELAPQFEDGLIERHIDAVLAGLAV